MPEVTLPYKYEVRDYLLPFLRAKQRFQIAVIHRRGGKSRAALNKQIIKTQLKKGVYYYVLPTYKQAKQVIWDELINDHLPMEIVEKKNDSELAIYYKNGSIQRFVGCEDPDKHRGVNAIDWVFDEFSEQNPKMWTDIAQPVIRENGGTASFIFTPKGKTFSYKLLQLAKEDPNNWFWCVLPASDTGVFSFDELQAAQRSMPQAMYEQEFMCSFVEGSSSLFRRVLNNVYKEVPQYPKPSHSYQLGVDLAKYNDFTVITPFDLTTFEALPQIRFNQIDWNLQKSRIEAEWLRFNRGKIYIDQTGLGDPITEDLQKMGLDVEGFKFTENSKRELLTNLSVMLEQDKIKIPNDDGLIEELQGMQNKITDGGKLKIESATEHDDRVMSLALAVWQAPEIALRGGVYHSTYQIADQGVAINDAFRGYEGV